MFFYFLLLLQEMMTRLISETPDQPVPFLITHLQDKKSSPVLLQNVLLGSAALWAQTPAQSKGVRWAFNEHEKSWQDHPRRPKKSKSDLEVCNLSPPSPESKSTSRSAERPCWDSRTRPESHDFDELSHILQESKKLGKALESLSRSLIYQKEPRSYNSPLPRPRVFGQWVGREDSDADPLAAEMLHPPIPRDKGEDSSPSGRLQVEPKSKGLKQQQQQHKKQLAALLSQETFNSSTAPDPSVAELDTEDEDDAMELMEDLEDLRMEGVMSLAPCRNKVIQVHGSYSPQPQAKLTLNICSRCARFVPSFVFFLHKCSWQLSEWKWMMENVTGTNKENCSQVVFWGPMAKLFPKLLLLLYNNWNQNVYSASEETDADVLAANRSEELTKMTEDSSLMNPNSPLSSLLSSPLVLQSLSLPDQPSKPTSSLSMPSNKPTSLLLGPPETLSNSSSIPITALGSLMMPSATPSRHSNMEKSPGAFSWTVTQSSRAGLNIPISSHSQAASSKSVTPTHQLEWALHTNQVGWSINQQGKSRSVTPTEQAGWSKTFMHSNYTGRSRSVTPTDPAGWSRSITLTSQGRRSVPVTPTDPSGWSIPMTSTIQGRRSRPITPTDQFSWSRSIASTDMAGWSKPEMPTSQGRRSRPVTPTDQAGRSRSVTPTDLSGWNKPITPTGQGRRSRPVTPTDPGAWSRPVTPTSQGRRSRPVTPTDLSGWSRPVTPTDQAGRTRPITPTSHGRRSRPVTPTDQAGRSRSVTPTNQATRSRPATPTDQSGRSRTVTPTDHPGRHLLTPTTLSSEVLWPNINQISVLSEAEFYQELQAMRQPWLLPSDTDSENGGPDGGPV
ncbi:hypothetical protein GN956_G17512 [Arapaima gigas]